MSIRILLTGSHSVTTNFLSSVRTVIGHQIHMKQHRISFFRKTSWGGWPCCTLLVEERQGVLPTESVFPRTENKLETKILWESKLRGMISLQSFLSLLPWCSHSSLQWPLTNPLLELLCQIQSLSKNWKSCHLHYLLSWQYALEMPYNRRNVVMSYRVKWLATFCLRKF